VLGTSLGCPDVHEVLAAVHLIVTMQVERADARALDTYKERAPQCIREEDNPTTYSKYPLYIHMILRR